MSLGLTSRGLPAVFQLRPTTEYPWFRQRHVRRRLKRLSLACRKSSKMKSTADSGCFRQAVVFGRLRALAGTQNKDDGGSDDCLMLCSVVTRTNTGVNCWPRMPGMRLGDVW